MARKPSDSSDVQKGGDAPEAKPTKGSSTGEGSKAKGDSESKDRAKKEDDEERSASPEASDGSPEEKDSDEKDADEEEQEVDEYANLPGADTESGIKLRRAYRAFERGDYQTVRTLCDELSNDKDKDIVLSAADIRRRTEVDPVQIGVVLACVILFGVIAYFYVL
ncbi:MAG: hypothetical protein AAGF12_14815 [Myxococcota bacterium]